ncbi:MAG TPA: DinB family protein [Acidobacteriaceae bacterium]|jgi:uncharacterized damage-inducible protein DinB|nr:DinB family protein [Acidobacteriaceae bacterium]
MSNTSTNAPAKLQTMAEPWLRGTLSDRPAEQRAVLHALELARDDIARWCASLTTTELHARPYDLASVAFHLRHIVRSLDRLLTYAESGQLSDTQKQQMIAEMTPGEDRDAVFEEFSVGLDAAEQRIRAIPLQQWPENRGVGRKQLPTTVAGLLIHCADHTQRHVGQAITTAKVVMALRGEVKL